MLHPILAPCTGPQPQLHVHYGGTFAGGQFTRGASTSRLRFRINASTSEQRAGCGVCGLFVCLFVLAAASAQQLACRHPLSWASGALKLERWRLGSHAQELRMRLPTCYLCECCLQPLLPCHSANTFASAASLVVFAARAAACLSGCLLPESPLPCLPFLISSLTQSG